ncbi:MAG TPA: ferredoxin-type protein NapF [Burkholderiales bacterium]|nr:ferredoxin-type protein NapF [Burkholderiales bacterium]
MDIARRRFLRGDFAAPRPPLRPPWALDEAAFLQRCTRCDACRDACPSAILVHGTGGYPEVDFTRGECTFCGECLNACSAGALQLRNLPWSLRPAISGACLARNRVACRSCGDACSAHALRFGLAPGGVAIPYIVDDACTGCGACVSVCPVSAIAVHSRNLASLCEEAIA